MRRQIVTATLMFAALTSAPGCGGATTPDAGAGGGGGSSSMDAGTGGGGGTTAVTVNGCTAATAEDHTADQTTVVTTPGFNYAPRCIRISAGASVTFMSSFTSHPLVAGTVENGAKQPASSSPIVSTSSGTQVTFAFPQAGAYGYYCDLHALSGMTGAVFVE